MPTRIFCMSVVLWAMTYYPRLPQSRTDSIQAAAQTVQPQHVEQALAAAQREYSIAGRFGHAMEPAIRPLGYDWKMGVGLVSAFAAREVFVSTMSIVYAAGDVEEHGTKSLSTAMTADRYSTGPRAGATD